MGTSRKLKLSIFTIKNTQNKFVLLVGEIQFRIRVDCVQNNTN